MKDKIIELSEIIRNYNDEELEGRLNEVNRWYEIGFTELENLVEFNLLTNEILRRNNGEKFLDPLGL